MLSCTLMGLTDTVERWRLSYSTGLILTSSRSKTGLPGVMISTSTQPTTTLRRTTRMHRRLPRSRNADSGAIRRCRLCHGFLAERPNILDRRNSYHPAPLPTLHFAKDGLQRISGRGPIGARAEVVVLSLS